MIGFTGKLQLKTSNKESEPHITNNEVVSSHIKIKRTSNGKFSDDKLFFIKSNKLFLLEGVITNKQELLEKYDKKNWQEVVYRMSCQDSLTFYSEFRGSFCGCMYDFTTQELLLYVDHFRTKDVFYTIENNCLYFGTNLQDLAQINQSSNCLNINAAYLLLTFGATLEKNTLFERIHKLSYGSFLKVDKNYVCKEKSYYKIKIDYSNMNKSSKEDYDNYIDRLDAYFRHAIYRQFSKDSEYGYHHLVALSGGRDSRMTTWVSHSMGFNKNVLNFTFSETNQLDGDIPKQIARKLKNEWIFKSLDNGLCFENFEEINSILCGEISLQNVLHGNSLMSKLNYDKLGLIHTGQIGDGIVNYYGSKELSNSLFDLEYIQSKKLLSKVVCRNILSLASFTSDEEFTHVNRGIGVTLKSALLYYQYSETFSPFNDLDFFNYCLTVPYDIRSGFKFYDDWILRKYPEAAKFPHNYRKIGGIEFQLFGKSISLHDFPSRLYRFMTNRILGVGLKNNMNPMDYWYSTNNNLKRKIDSYFKKNINLIEDKELKEDCVFLYSHGSMGEKMQVITLLSTLKLYFN